MKSIHRRLQPGAVALALLVLVPVVAQEAAAPAAEPDAPVVQPEEPAAQPDAPAAQPPDAPAVVPPVAPPDVIPGVRRQVPAPGMRLRQPARPLNPVMPVGAGGNAADSAGAARTADGSVDITALKFEGAPVDIVLQTYAEVTGRTLLMAPDVPKATITLRSQSDLTKEEFLQAIETALVMNGVALQPVGEKFLKVLPAKDIRRLGAKTEFDEPAEGRHTEDGKMVSQMVVLKSISLDEARKAIEGFKRNEGQIQIFERTNSILITDTVDNVNRMMEILKYIDQPLINREETNIRPILHAKATDIKKRLEEIIAESQKAQQQAKSAPEANPAGAPGIQRRALPAPVPVPGVIRPAGRPETPAADENTILETLVADAERGVIRGKVQIVADERTNLLIIITRPENMAFFDKIISVLDVETAPDVIVEVFRLEYAQVKDTDGAKGVASMLNELIGNPKKADEGGKAPAGTRGTEATGSRGVDLARSQSLAEAAAARVERSRQETVDAGGEPGMSKVGELSKDNIKILADERTNALIIMASKSDLATLREIIRSMDIMLSQVLVETVVLEIGLTDELSTGIDWVQRTLISGEGDRLTAFAGRGGGGSGTPVDTMTLQTPGSLSAAAGGVSYYATFFGLNVDAVIQAAASDSRARTLASPVILTLDNKEATIEATQDKYFFKGKRYAGTQADGQTAYEDDVETKSVGITVKVTPRINEKGFVVMKIDEKIQGFGEPQIVNKQEWPVVNSRNLTAEVAVQSGQTIVLGGLVNSSTEKTRSKIPLLGDIPYLGRLFRSDRYKESRTEVMVFLTPYVLDTPEELQAYSRRRKIAADAGEMWTQGFSGSRLADPPDRETTRRLHEAGIDPAAPIGTKSAVRIVSQPQAILDDRTILTTNAPQPALDDQTSTNNAPSASLDTEAPAKAPAP